MAIIIAFSLTACAVEGKEKNTEEPKPAHTYPYAQYVCSGCGEEDGSHAYEYLVEWVKENGTHTDIGTLCALPVENSVIAYNESNDYLCAYLISDVDNFSCALMLTLDNYSFKYSINEDSIIGIAGASEYTRNQGGLQIIHSNCVNLTPTECAEFAEVDIAILLESLIEFLEDENLGITVADLGFTSYENESTQP